MFIDKNNVLLYIFTSKKSKYFLPYSEKVNAI